MALLDVTITRSSKNKIELSKKKKKSVLWENSFIKKVPVRKGYELLKSKW